MNTSYHPVRALRQLFLPAITLAIALGFSTQAAVVILSPGKDNTLYENANLSNGAGSYLFAGRSGGSGGSLILRSLVYFDVASQVPAGATIDAVALTLTANTPKGNSSTVELHRSQADWGEGTSVAGSGGAGGAPATTGDATWTQRIYNSLAWSTPGGDYDGTLSASQTISGNGAFSFSSATLNSDVQGWLDSPSLNFGWFLINANEASTGNTIRFASREDGTSRPQLQITYTPVPEPGMLLFLAAGMSGWVMVRRFISHRARW